MNRRPTKRAARPDEPGIAEVRRWRAKVIKESGGTLAGLLASLRKSHEAQSQAKPEDRAQRSGRRRPAA